MTESKLNYSINEAIKKAHEDALKAGIKERFIKISRTLKCDCGYEGLALKSHDMKTWHSVVVFLFPLLGLIAILITLYIKKQKCPKCERNINKIKLKDHETPVISEESIFELISGMRKIATRTRNIYIGIFIFFGLRFLIVFVQTFLFQT